MSFLERSEDLLFGVTGSLIKSSAAAPDQIECFLCCDEVEAGNSLSLGCDHLYCKGCWARYLSTKCEENELLNAGCPDPTCQLLVTRYELQTHFSDLVEPYNEAVKRHFVDANPDLGTCMACNRVLTLSVWCKNPKTCSGIITRTPGNPIVDCSICSLKFCSSCEFPAHAPASCEMLSEWQAYGQCS